MPAAGRLRRTGRSRAVDRFLAVRRPRGSKDSSIYEGLRSLSSPTSDQFRAGASLPAPAPFTSRPPPRAAFLVGMTSSPASTSPASAAPMQPPSPKPRAPSVTQPAHAFMRLRVARESWPKKGHQLALRAPFLATALPFAKVGCACSVFPLIRGLRLVARRGDARRWRSLQAIFGQNVVPRLWQEQLVALICPSASTTSDASGATWIRRSPAPRRGTAFVFYPSRRGLSSCGGMRPLERNSSAAAMSRLR